MWEFAGVYSQVITPITMLSTQKYFNIDILSNKTLGKYVQKVASIGLFTKQINFLWG